VITDCYFTADGSSPVRELYGGQHVTLHIEAQAERDVAQPIFGFIFRNERGQNLFGDNTFQTYRNRPVGLRSGQKVTAKLSFQFPYLPAGTFGLSPSLIEGTQQDHSQLDWLEDALVVSVTNSDVRGGEIGFRHFGIRPIGKSGTASSTPE
jgi:lipopolysaccharide transport system ATP-binding protein